MIGMGERPTIQAKRRVVGTLTARLGRAAEAAGLTDDDLDRITADPDVAEDKARYYALVGARLIEARRAARLSVRELAEAAGTSVLHLTEIERGEADPGIHTMLDLAGVLDLDLRTFLVPPDT
jgi:DNA-binding XRE family transcriptional regulator